MRTASFSVLQPFSFVRFRAAIRVSTNSWREPGATAPPTRGKGHTIPASIRELTGTEWLEVQPIENLKHPDVHELDARREGALNNPSPMHDFEISRSRPAGEAHAYSLEEEIRMLAILPEPAATGVAAPAFTGARKGELRAFLRENYDGFEIRIVKSAW